MIENVSFTVKGDYNELTLKRKGGNNYVELQFMYYNGCQYARFKFDDLKKAVEILSEQDNDDG